MEVGFKSDKGLKRANNEDACFVLLPDKVYVVADGVGGEKAGEIASRMAVSQIASHIMDVPLKTDMDKYEIAAYFFQCTEKVNAKIHEMAKKYTENHGMATTIVIVYVNQGKAYITNVGDSRAYLYRSGILTQLTEDHTYVNELVKSGVITAEEALVDPRKNVITRALGAQPTIEPDFYQVDIAEGDRLVVCTDGLYDEVSNEEMIEILNKDLSMSQTGNELIKKANENGGHDNITVICLKVTEEEVNG